MAIQIWGHRGHRHHRAVDFYQNIPHENSLRAYDETLRHAYGLECDVILSKSAQIYLTHDTLFDGVVHYELKIHLDEDSKVRIGSHYIYELDDATIDQLRLKDGQKLPRLEQLLDLVKKYPWSQINLELKGPYTTDVTLRAVEAAIQKKIITPDNIIFSSFNLPALRDLREKCGNRFKIGALFAASDLPRAPMYPGWPRAPQDADYVPFDESALKSDLVKAIAPDYFNLELSCVTPVNLFAMHQVWPKAKVVVWTAGETHPKAVDKSKDVVKAFAALAHNPQALENIHAIITDFPIDVQAGLIEKGINVALNPVLKANRG